MLYFVSGSDFWGLKSSGFRTGDCSSLPCIFRVCIPKALRVYGPFEDFTHVALLMGLSEDLMDALGFPICATDSIWVVVKIMVPFWVP